MFLFEIKVLVEIYFLLKNIIDNGVWEVFKKSDRVRKKERIKILWVVCKRKERIVRIVLRL